MGLSLRWWYDWVGGLRKRERADESLRRGQKRGEQRRTKRMWQQRKQKEREVVGWRKWRAHGER